MPEFAHLFSLFLNFWLVVLGSGLEQEAHLRTHAEVGHRQYAELAEKRVPAQFDLILVLLEELLHRYRLDLHDVADVQIVDPLVLVEEAEHTAHVGLFFFELIVVCRWVGTSAFGFLFF